MNNNAMQLQHQWLKRPEDQCFDTVANLHDFNLKKQAVTRQQTANLAEVRVVVDDGDLLLDTNGKRLVITNYAFNKLTQQIGASTEYLRKLSPELVADNMNYGFDNYGKKSFESLNAWEIDESGRAVDTNTKLIYHNNTANELINIVSPRYSILFDAELTSFALKLQDKFGLHPAPVTKSIDGKFNHYGLYASHSDCFVFLSTSDRPVLEFAQNPIYKGMMLWNGFDETFGYSLFLFSGICCNYSIHQFTEKFSFNLRHTSKFFDRYKPDEMLVNLEKAFIGDNREEKEWLAKATKISLGHDEKEVLEELAKLRLPLLGKRTSQRVYEMSLDREDSYGEPCTVYSLGNCITEIARDVPIASIKRNYMQTAQKVFDLAA